jgi:hypothetical protein
MKNFYVSLFLGFTFSSSLRADAAVIKNIQDLKQCINYLRRLEGESTSTRIFFGKGVQLRDRNVPTSLEVPIDAEFNESEKIALDAEVVALNQMFIGFSLPAYLFIQPILRQNGDCGDGFRILVDVSSAPDVNGLRFSRAYFAHEYGHLLIHLGLVERAARAIDLDLKYFHELDFFRFLQRNYPSGQIHDHAAILMGGELVEAEAAQTVIREYLENLEKEERFDFIYNSAHNQEINFFPYLFERGWSANIRYEELLADLVTVLYLKEPNAISKALSSRGIIEVARKFSSGLKAEDSWDPDPHSFYALVRNFIGENYLLNSKFTPSQILSAVFDSSWHDMVDPNPPYKTIGGYDYVEGMAIPNRQKVLAMNASLIARIRTSIERKH